MARFDVTIAGELNLDLILYGLPEVLLPERELLATGMMLTLGSSSAIVAHNLASLGCKVGFSSCVGADDFGELRSMAASSSHRPLKSQRGRPSAYEKIIAPPLVLWRRWEQGALIEPPPGASRPFP